MSKLYLDAAAEYPAPQAITAGTFWDGERRYDWEDLSDDEIARRGFALYVPSNCDPAYERETFEFSTTEDGRTVAETKVMPGDLDTALAAARARLANRRWQAEVGGMVWEGMAVSTDDRSQAKVTSANAKANRDPTFTIPNWKAAPGEYITLVPEVIIELGDALTAHVQACFDREAAVDAMLAQATDAYAVRDTLAAEIDKGWPANTVERG